MKLRAAWVPAVLPGLGKKHGGVRSLGSAPGVVDSQSRDGNDFSGISLEAQIARLEAMTSEAVS